MKYDRIRITGDFYSSFNNNQDSRYIVHFHRYVDDAVIDIC